MFSMRESPSATAPASRSTRPSAGKPAHRLGDRGDRDTTCRRATYELVRVLADAIEIDLDAWGAHTAAMAGCSAKRRERTEHHVQQRIRGPGEGVGRRDPEDGFVSGDRNGDLGVGHRFVVDRDPDDLRSCERLDQVDLADNGGHRHVREVTDDRARGCVLEDHAGREAAAEDRRRAQVGGVAQRALAFDDDHVRTLDLEGLDDRRLELAGDELRRDRVERDAVPRSLDQGRLAGADHHGPDTRFAQCAGQDRGRGALADRAVRAEHGDPRTGDLVDPPREHVQVRLGARASNIGDPHVVHLPQPRRTRRRR